MWGLRLCVKVSVLHASSLSQVITSQLLAQWGTDGFFSHIDSVEQFYKARRDKMLAAADKHLTGLCQFSAPLGGMFLWLKVPRLSSTWDMIMERGIQRNIMLMPGKVQWRFSRTAVLISFLYISGLPT